MKIAVCLAGQPRSVLEAFPFTKRSFSTYGEVDFFIHFWKGKTHTDPDDPNLPLMQNQSDEKLYEKVLDLFSPKRFLFEMQPDFSYNSYYTERFGNEKNFNLKFPITDLEIWAKNKDTLFNTYGDRPHNIVSQFTSWKTCMQLKKSYEQEHYFVYDCVVRLRPDFITPVQFDYEKFDMNIFYVKNDCDHHISKGDWYAINDHFAISSSENMDYYHSLIDYMPKYYVEDCMPVAGEVMLGWHLLKSGKQVMKLDFPSTILRG